MDIQAKSLALNLFENHFNLILPELFLGTVGMLLLVYGVLLGTRKSILTKNIIWLVIQTMVICIILIQNNYLGSWSIFDGTLKIDDLGSVIKTMVLLSSISCLLISLDYVKQDKMNLFEYPLLTLLSVLGMLFLISSLDFISLYLAIELQSLSFYVLAALKRGSSFSTEAALKYFILGAFSSGLLLFGSSLIYGFSGTTNFEELSKLLLGVGSSSSLHTLGIVSGVIFVTSALLFKVGAFPFHMWLPDVYEGVSTPITVFFAAVPKAVLLGLFIRLYGSIFPDMMYAWQKMIVLCSFGSMIVACFGGLYQRRLKRLFAYSSIGHGGYMLIGLSTGLIEGFQGVLVYIAIYIFMTLGVFCIILSTRKQSDGYRVKYLTDYTSLAYTNSTLAIAFCMILFSMIGVPPLAGFYGKFSVFLAGMKSSLYTLAIIGVASSVVSSAYYIRMIKLMYIDKCPKVLWHSPLEREVSLSLGVCVSFVVLFMMYPVPLYLLMDKVSLLI